MKKILFYIVLCTTGYGYSQDTLSELLDKFNDESVPYISVNELAMPKNKAILLDAREQNEYDVSHLKDAVHVGYDQFDLNAIVKGLQDKNEMIVVYCTLGVRSEDIAEQLKEAGYTNVYNLYGGIVEWKNNDHIVFDIQDNETNKVHVCNEFWSKWLTKGEKIYDR